MTIAQAFNEIAVAQGGTASTSGTIAGAIDALNDALAGSDQQSAQTIEDAVRLLGQNIGGGSSVTVESLTATENKTYTAPEGKAYSPVTVNVSGGGAQYGNAVSIAYTSETPAVGNVGNFEPSLIIGICEGHYILASAGNISYVGQGTTAFTYDYYGAPAAIYEVATEYQDEDEVYTYVRDCNVTPYETYVNMPNESGGFDQMQVYAFEIPTIDPSRFVCIVTSNNETD